MNLSAMLILKYLEPLYGLSYRENPSNLLNLGASRIPAGAGALAGGAGLHLRHRTGISAVRTCS